MAGRSSMQGSPWHEEIHYVKQKRRNPRACSYYREFESFCKKRKGKCIGTTRCDFFTTAVIENEVPRISKMLLESPYSKNLRVGGEIIHKDKGLGKITKITGRKIYVSFIDGDKIILDSETCIQKKLIDIVK